MNNEDESELQRATDLWRRAQRALASAELLHASGDFDGAANRAYYAVFHAASAVFAISGQYFTTHKAVESAVHRELIRLGGWPAEVGQAYIATASARRIGGYGAPIPVDVEDSAGAIALATRFLAEVQRRHGENLSVTPAPLFDPGRATDG